VRRRKIIIIGIVTLGIGATNALTFNCPDLRTYSTILEEGTSFTIGSKTFSLMSRPDSLSAADILTSKVIQKSNDRCTYDVTLAQGGHVRVRLAVE
jgi:hypothetical protein